MLTWSGVDQTTVCLRCGIPPIAFFTNVRAHWLVHKWRERERTFLKGYDGLQRLQHFGDGGQLLVLDQLFDLIAVAQVGGVVL